MEKSNYILHEGLWWQKLANGNGAFIWVSFDGRVVNDLDVAGLPQVSAEKWEDLDWSNTARVCLQAANIVCIVFKPIMCTKCQNVN